MMNATRVMMMMLLVFCLSIFYRLPRGRLVTSPVASIAPNLVTSPVAPHLLPRHRPSGRGPLAGAREAQRTPRARSGLPGHACRTPAEPPQWWLAGSRWWLAYGPASAPLCLGRKAPPGSSWQRLAPQRARASAAAERPPAACSQRAHMRPVAIASPPLSESGLREKRHTS